MTLLEFYKVLDHNLICELNDGNCTYLGSTISVCGIIPILKDFHIKLISRSYFGRVSIFLKETVGKKFVIENPIRQEFMHKNLDLLEKNKSKVLERMERNELDYLCHKSNIKTEYKSSSHFKRNLIPRKTLINKYGDIIFQNFMNQLDQETYKDPIILMALGNEMIDYEALK